MNMCVYMSEFGVSVTVYVLGEGIRKDTPLSLLPCRISLHRTADQSQPGTGRKPQVLPGWALPPTGTPNPYQQNPLPSSQEPYRAELSRERRSHLATICSILCAFRVWEKVFSSSSIYLDGMKERRMFSGDEPKPVMRTRHIHARPSEDPRNK